MDFELQIAKWCDDTEKVLDDVIYFGMIEVCKRLISRTPIGMPDTWKHRAPPGYVPGTARAGWHTSTGAPLVRLPERPDAAGRATLAAMVADLPRQPSGKVMFISNNVPYIEELERGWSKQSPPAAMVGLTVMEFNSIIDEKALEVVH